MTEFTSGNIYIRVNALDKKGDKVVGHKHNFDHTTIVFKGAVRVRAISSDGNKLEREYAAPSHFLVRAGVEHEITATSNDTLFWCVYSHRNAQGEVVQERDSLPAVRERGDYV